MELIIVGLNYKTAPVELREQLSYSKNALAEPLQQLHEIFDEAVILSTCNRTEIYAVIEDQQIGYALLADYLSFTHNIPIRTFLPHLYYHIGEDAVRHLFTVTAGVDSMILGEPQILGQVREAFAQAQEVGTVGKYLSLLFRCALHTGKRVRTETRISQGAASVSHATVEIARQMLGEMGKCHIAVIGAGEMGKLLTLCFKDAGCNEFTVVSHNFSHAQELASVYEGANAIEFSALDDALLKADLALTLLDSPTIIIDYAHTVQLSQQRKGRMLYIIDLAVPRNVESDVCEVPGIQIFDIDDLQSVVQSNMKLRLQEMEHIEAILDEEVRDFNEEWRSTLVAPIITALRQKAEDIRQSELAKALPKLRDLSDKDLHIVQTLTTRIINRLLHEPVSELRAKGDPEQAELIRELFFLTVGEATKSEQSEYKGKGFSEQAV